MERSDLIAPEAWKNPPDPSRPRNPASRESGISLVEMLVGLVLAVIVGAAAFAVYRYLTQNYIRNKQTEALHTALADATDCLSKYLVGSGLGVLDTLFYAPNGLSNDAFTSVERPIWRMSADSTVLTAFGNYSGQVAFLARPVNRNARREVTVNNPAAFAQSRYAYLFSGGNQEVARITGRSGATLAFARDLLAEYPTGTLIQPVEKLVVRVLGRSVLQVYRQSAGGDSVLLRTFSPTGSLGDTVEFAVTRFVPRNKDMAFRLRFAHRSKATQGVTVSSESRQSVLLRGF